MAEEIQEVAPKPYVGKMVHYYPSNLSVDYGSPVAALIVYVSPVAVDLYVFPDYATIGEPRGENGRGYSPYPKPYHWTNIPEESA